jgi:hypothetical protein
MRKNIIDILNRTLINKLLLLSFHIYVKIENFPYSMYYVYIYILCMYYKVLLNGKCVCNYSMNRTL